MQVAALPFEWDQERLWRFAKPAHSLPMTQLEWHLDVPFWSHDGVPFQVTPRQVAMSPGLYAAQFRRTLASDLQYPLVVIKWRGRWTILDGVHRLLKARLAGLDPISVRCVDRADLRLIRAWRVDLLPR